MHLRTAAVVEPAAGKRATSAGWLVSASDVGAEGGETPRLQAAGKVPTVAALGSRAPRGAATKHTEQSTHQAAIWAALVYAGQCLAKGRKVTLTVESVTALRNLHTAPTDASNPQEDAASGETSAHPPQRQGAARPTESNGNKRQRPNPRPDLKRGRDGDGSASAGGATPARTALIEENKRMLKALSQRYPGQLELRAPLGATPLNLRM